MLSIVDTTCPLSRSMPSRRDLLRIGSLALGGLALPGLFEGSPCAAGQVPGANLVQTNKSVILLFLQGGPPQVETFDPKLDAPDNYRSCTGVVKTRLPGVWFGGTFPKMAERADRLAIVRSYGSGENAHEQYVALNGGNALKATMGAVAARGKGLLNSRTGVPNHVLAIPEAVEPKLNLTGNTSPVFSLPYILEHYGASGALGPTCEAFVPRGGNTLLDDMTLKIPGERFGDRRMLLQKFDDLRRNIERLPDAKGVNALREQAFAILDRGIGGAFDISREDPRTLERYDTSRLFDMDDYHTGGKHYNNKMNQNRITNLLGRQLLLARRLCEAGCGFVTVVDSGWDLHGDGNNPNMIQGMPILGNQVDHAVSAFLDDVQERGLSEQILLVITGEMGRTPLKFARSEGNVGPGGTGHWSEVTPLVFAGGGLKMGQVIGETDRTASQAVTERYGPSNLLATILQVLFNAAQARITPEALPVEVNQLLNEGQPIGGLM
jgi:hypothetical protein